MEAHFRFLTSIRFPAPSTQSTNAGGVTVDTKVVSSSSDCDKSELAVSQMYCLQSLDYFLSNSFVSVGLDLSAFLESVVRVAKVAIEMHLQQGGTGTVTVAGTGQSRDFADQQQQSGRHPSSGSSDCKY